MIASSQSIQNLRDKKTSGKKLSIYIPTHPKSSGPSVNEDTTRFKNALQDIKNDSSYDKRALGSTIDALYELLEDTDFWKHQDIGLAVFANSEKYEVFNLPYELTAATYITDEFVISPLVITQSIGTGFYVLDINLDSPRLCRSVNGTLQELELNEMPGSFQEAAARDDYKMELQHQSSSHGTDGGASFHGHDPAENVDDDIARYLRMIADAANDYLKDREEPLILSGTSSRVGNIRHHLTYSNVLQDSASGNKENLTAQQLYDETISIATAYDANKRQASVDKLLSSAPEYVVVGAAEIQEAAAAGRVERLYLPVYRKTTDSVRPGDFESIILQLPEDISEIEKLVKATMDQGGEVLATEIDSYEGADKPRALCRY